MYDSDDFTSYHQELLDGRYDCVDRIVLNGYFSLGQTGGGFRCWWRELFGSDATLNTNHLQRMAGDFSRRLHAFAKQNKIPVVHCETGTRKHEIAEKYLPDDPSFQGLFLILVAKSPALVWDVRQCKSGAPHLERKKPWPYVNHYHFHIIDKEWGHLTIKMSGHPPFGIQVMLNGHEWVERQAREQTISMIKEGNCFVEGSDFMALNQIADTLCQNDTIGQLAKVCDRWVYSTCLCFALNTKDQESSRFHYQYSCYQIEYSRNLLFQLGAKLDSVYQGLIDRTRSLLDVNKLKTIFGRKNRPSATKASSPKVERVLDSSTFDLTVFKVHFGKLTLKMYDKGEKTLRIEAIAHNTKELKCGRVLAKVPDMLTKLEHMVTGFLNVISAANISFLDDGILDTISEPTQRGNKRLAGIDLQKPRMRTVCEAALALAASPRGFSSKDLAGKAGEIMGNDTYTARQAAYDMNKLRGKSILVPIAKSRRYCLSIPGVRILAGLIILREKVIKPLLAGICKESIARPPNNERPIDSKYERIRHDMLGLLNELHLTPT
jgi:hypothetical protein